MPALSKIYTRKQIDEIRNKLIKEHGDICAICKKPSSAFKKRLSVDHAHKSGRIRGLLCFRCNKFLVGRQTIETATKLLNYLTKYDLPEEK
jgi:hypothetical protein